MTAIDQLAANVRKALDASASRVARLEEELAAFRATTKSAEDEIESIPGRRIPMHPTQTVAFTASDADTRGSALQFKLSQDGPFIMTHYPVVAWRVSLPSNATNYGQWRPVYHWPLPTQSVTSDFISISWEMIDQGPQQNFQDNAMPPIFSRPDRLVPLPRQCKFAPLSVVHVIPTYHDINFNSGGTATTGGTLVVTLIGYRIFNLRG